VDIPKIKYVVQRKFANERHGGTGWIDWASDDDFELALKDLDFAAKQEPTRKFRLVKRTLEDKQLSLRLGDQHL
jgi:hypothetical protein